MPYSAKMRSSLRTSALSPFSRVYLGRFFSPQKSSCRFALITKTHDRSRLDDLLYRQPIPVCLKRKDLKAELERAIFSTYMHQNRGTCTCVPHCKLIRNFFEGLTNTSVSHSSVKFGTLSQSPAQVLANLETALPAIIAAVRGGWDNVQSLNIKSTKSLSLPIWSCKLGTGDGARWHGLTLEDEDGESDEDDESAMPEVPHKTKMAKANKHPPSRGKKPVAA